MFKIITPFEHRLNKDLVQPFLKELTLQELALGDPLPDLSKAIFILAKEHPGRINGGALLFQQKVEMLHPLLKEQLSPFVLPEEEIWMGSIILELTSAISGQDYMCFSKLFYGKLYKYLQIFGKEAKTSFICLSLGSGDYLTTDRLTFWPYLITIKPSQSGDSLYHAVLGLKGLFPETSHLTSILGQQSQTLNDSPSVNGFAA